MEPGRAGGRGAWAARGCWLPGPPPSPGGTLRPSGGSAGFNASLSLSELNLLQVVLREDGSLGRAARVGGAEELRGTELQASGYPENLREFVSCDSRGLWVDGTGVELNKTKQK